MEFLFELLKEFVKAIVREVSAYVFRKQILEKDNKNPLLVAVQSKRVGFVKINDITTTLTVAVIRRDVSASLLLLYTQAITVILLQQLYQMYIKNQ
ncbi:hypothetical protein AAHB59_00150 [Bacillus cereus]